MKSNHDKLTTIIVVVVLLLGLFTGCRSGPSASNPPTARSSPSTTVSISTPQPPRGDEYANAVRAAVRHGLRVWLESDLVKRWRAGAASFNQAVAQLATLAAIPGVVGIKIADEIGYRDGLTTTPAITQFLKASSTAMKRVAPGKQLLVDMIVPELGCLPDQHPPLLWSTQCTVKLRGQYPQLTLQSVTSYLQLDAISVLDLSTGLLSNSAYAGWGADRDIAQTAAWAKVRKLGWGNLVELHARKALAHSGVYSKSAKESAADLVTWVDIPLAQGAAEVDIWTWRQMYRGSVSRILNPNLQSNVLWTGLQQRRARGDQLMTHLSPNSLEVGLDADLAKMAEVFSDVFIAAGTG